MYILQDTIRMSCKINGKSIYDEYFEYVDKYFEQFPHSCVLFEVGSFFEVYSYRISSEDPPKFAHPHVSDIAKICNLQFVEKKTTYMVKSPERSASLRFDLTDANESIGYPIYMMGFRNYALDKYVQKLIDSNYTVIVFVQEKEGKSVYRKLHHIYSPGTYLSMEPVANEKASNNIMCIWIETYKNVPREYSGEKGMIIGMSSVNIYSGHSSMFEYSCSYITVSPTSVPSLFDELERFVSTFQPTEVIVISVFDEPTTKQIIQYVGISALSTHLYCNIRQSSEEPVYTKIDHCTNQIYISEILSTYFGKNAYHSYHEFTMNEMATQSLCFLLNFIQEHNPDLIRHIQLPQFANTSKRLILGNHSLRQLHIIEENEDTKVYGKLSSVSNFLNRCNTMMGRRRFQYQLLHPSFDTIWLQEEYDMISYIHELLSKSQIGVLRKQLGQIYDIERFLRQLLSRKVLPTHISHIYKSIMIIRDFTIPVETKTILDKDLESPRFPSLVMKSPHRAEAVDGDESISGDAKSMDMDAKPRWTLHESSEVAGILCDSKLYAYVMERTDSPKLPISDFLTFIDSKFILENCHKGFEERIIQRGVSEELDERLRKQEQNMELLNAIKGFLNHQMQITEGSTGGSVAGASTEFIRIHETEKSGKTLQITKKRAKVLQRYLQSISVSSPNIVLGENTIPINEIRFISATTSNDEIDFPLLSKIRRELLYGHEKINELVVSVFAEILKEIEIKWFSFLEKIVQFISKLDVLVTKAYLAREYNYTKPTMDIRESSDTSTSFFQATQLRHCLLEHIQTQELYVANDVELKGDGIILYGTNAIGKTSLIRAIGIAIIMAQSGMYVPCQQFHYRPYRSIYTRIIGNDNLFKNLSSFQVEMSELQHIIKFSDASSLILGDELCSTSESQSAISIILATLMHLNTVKSSFIFTTHFFELLEYEEIQERMAAAAAAEGGGGGGVRIQHLSVHYDQEKQTLVYDRKLQDGCGISFYGLIVCKSMFFPTTFLEKAFEIRNKYWKETSGILSNKSSRYNSQKLMGLCEVCKKKYAEETHHINEQKYANEEGFIDHFHKNMKGNLLSICSKCHKKIHGSS